MSFIKTLGSMFGTDREGKTDLDFKTISDEADISDILSASYKRTQVIYKHSTRCATSFFALKNIQQLPDEAKARADFYMIDVIGQRKLSTQVAEQLNVRHESPQLILLKDAEVYWHGSHHQVNAEALEANI